MKLSDPAIIVNIVGATVFFILSVFYTIMYVKKGPQSRNFDVAMFCGVAFVAVAISTAIQLSK